MSLSGGLYVYEDTHGSIQVLCQFFNELGAHGQDHMSFGNKNV